MGKARRGALRRASPRQHPPGEASGPRCVVLVVPRSDLRGAAQARGRTSQSRRRRLSHVSLGRGRAERAGRARRPRAAPFRSRILTPSRSRPSTRTPLHMTCEGAARSSDRRWCVWAEAARAELAAQRRRSGEHGPAGRASSSTSRCAACSPRLASSGSSPPSECPSCAEGEEGDANAGGQQSDPLPVRAVIRHAAWAWRCQRERAGAPHYVGDPHHGPKGSPEDETCGVIARGVR